MPFASQNQIADATTMNMMINDDDSKKKVCTDVTTYDKTFLYTACCFGYYHGISLVYWAPFVKTHHV